MKNILIIATGGTIACEESKEGLTPALNIDKLISYIPDVKALCNIYGISVMNVDSTNMSPELMKKIAQTVEDNYNSYDGFVVTHGTDTMAYSAAAVTYMLHNLSKPVVFTGSQYPIETEHTDAIKNLSDAVRFACEKVSGVYVVFNGRVINGTHAVKVCTRNIAAFESVNYPVVATIDMDKISYNQDIYNEMVNDITNSNKTDGYDITKINDSKIKDENRNNIKINNSKANDSEINDSEINDSKINYNEKNNSKIKIADTDMCDNVIVLKLFPGIDAGIFDYIKEHYKGVVLEGYGIGGIPGEGVDNSRYNIVDKIGELINSGVSVVVTTQCLYEGINLDVYEVGHILARKNVIVAADMTTEAIMMKLMWVLAHYTKQEDVKKYMETPYYSDRSY